MLQDLFGIGNPVPYLTISVLVGYGLGSVPYGLVLSRIFLGIDPRDSGSGNIGATNVLRLGGKKIAALTLALDAGKGAVAVLIMGGLWGPQAAICAAAGSLVGHIYPIWLRGRGGKGVATAFGCLLALDPTTGGLCLLLWLLTAMIFRYSSLAALVAVSFAPFWALYQHNTELVQITVIIAVFIWARHIPNLRRLLSGNEAKINF